MKQISKWLMILVLGLFCLSTAKAQIKVSGTVVDDKGEPLIGVQVIPVGAMQSGGLTDFDGKYTLSNVPSNVKQLKFTYMGFIPVTVNINGRKVIDLTMKEDAKQLETVVVTAMGIKRKSKSLTYATQSISNKDLTRVQDANFVNALQGKTAGLTITPNSGGAGSASKILLRGNASIQGNNAPLIVVDGVPMSNGVKNTNGYAMGYSAVSEGSDPLSSINPDDIANVNVLKGANAAALYGSDAANGVIIITTKSGRDGKIGVNVTSNVQFETPLLLPQLQNTYGANIKSGLLDGSSWGKRISEQTQAENDLENVTSCPYNLREFFNLGTTINNSIAITGGNKVVQSYLSVSNTSASGMIPNNTFQRNGVTMKETFNFLNDKLKIEVSGNYTHSVNKNPLSGGVTYNPLYNLYLAPRNLDVNYYKENFEKDGTWESNPITIYPEYNAEIKSPALLRPRPVTVDYKGKMQNWFLGRGVNGANNPFWLTNRKTNQTTIQRLYATLSASYIINDLFDVVYRANYDRSQNSNEGRTYATTVDPSGVYVDTGSFGWGKDRSVSFYTDALFNYHQTFGKDWNISASVGGSFKRFTGENFWMLNVGAGDRAVYTDKKYIPTLINHFVPNASYSSYREYSLPSDWNRSVFSTAQLGWKEKVYLEGSYRIDWSRAFSQFSDTVDPFYGYYSVGANAILNELISMPSWIDLLKIRTSLSEVGNSIPNFNFKALQSSNSGATSAAQYVSFDNPKPETVLSFEAGFDFSAINNRLNVDFTYYNSTMYNQFLPITGSSGTQLPINSGKIRNQGIEVSASYSINLTNDLLWRTSVNYAYNNNKILSTYNNRNDIFIQIGAGDQLHVLFQNGGSFGDIYAKDFLRYTKFDELYGRTTPDGKPVKEGNIRLNSDGQPSLDSNKGHSQYLGNINANHTFGWSNNISYKNFNFYFLIDGKIGGKVISFTEAFLDRDGVSKRSGDARNSDRKITWQFTDPKTNKPVSKEVPAVVMPDGNLAPAQSYYSTIGAQLFASEYVYDATNLRLREISIGYTFRDLFGNGKNLTTSIIGRNVLFLYNSAPVDPDVSISTSNTLGGVDIFNVPTSRSIGVNVSFSL